MNRGEPFIVCAANLFLDWENNPVIITGARHWDSVMRGQYIRMKDKIIGKEVEQGFIDQFGKFYDRKEALLIARESNQVRFELDHNPKELFSEMLY